MKPSSLSALLASTIQAKAPVLITGAPGVGKTDIVKQAATTAGADLIIEHPVVADPTDFKGLPFVVAGDRAEFLPFGSLRQLIEATAPLVCFLDDLGQAPPAVQAAAMQLLLARRINGHIVSDQVTFIAATNRRTDRAGVSGLLEPVKSRFATIVNLEPDLDDWVKWGLGAGQRYPGGEWIANAFDPALANGFPTELIAFIRFRPALLHDFRPTADLVNTPSPRTVANVGRGMTLPGLPRELEYETYAGAAGEAFAAEFLGFLRIFRNLPNPDLILLNPDQAEVPTDPATLYALVGALVRKASDNTFDRLARYFNRLPAEFSVLAIRDSVQSAPSVVNSRAFIEWASAHNNVLI